MCVRACVRECVRACMSIRVIGTIPTLLNIDAYQLFVLASKRLQKKTLKNICITNVRKTIVRQNCDNTDMNVTLEQIITHFKIILLHELRLWQSSCSSALWGRALTQGTKESVDVSLELVSLPYCNHFLCEFIPEAGGS